MGTLTMYEEIVRVLDNNKAVGNGSIEVRDNHGTPEVVIGPLDNAYQGWTAEFKDWEKFEKFVESINDLHSRLKTVKP